MANNALSLIFRPFPLPLPSSPRWCQDLHELYWPREGCFGPHCALQAFSSLRVEWWGIPWGATGLGPPAGIDCYLQPMISLPALSVLLRELGLPFLSLAAGLSETVSHPTSADKAQGTLSCFCSMPTGCSLAKVLAFNKMFTLHRETKEAWKYKLMFSVWTCSPYSGCWVSLSMQGVPCSGISLPSCHTGRSGQLLPVFGDTSSNWSLQRFQDLNIQHLHPLTLSRFYLPTLIQGLEAVEFLFFLFIRLYRIIGLVAQSCHLAN